MVDRNRSPNGADDRRRGAVDDRDDRDDRMGRRDTDGRTGGRPRRAAVLLAVLLCCAWIAGATVARRIAASDTGGAVAVSRTADVLIVVSLTAATVLLSGILGIGGSPVAAILFAVTTAGLAADGRLAEWDAVAAFLALTGAVLSASGGSRWGGLLLLGLACAGSPLCAGVLVVLVFSRSAVPARVVNVVAMVVIGCAGAAAIRFTTGRGVDAALAMGPEAARMATHDVWRLVAQWSNLVMGVLVFALLAASARFHDDDRNAENAPLNRFERIVVVWFAVNVLVGLILPRRVVDHGLLYALPCFLLVPAGWRLLRSLPVDRGSWTLSLFTIGCHTLPFALLWYPVRKVLEMAVVAVYPP